MAGDELMEWADNNIFEGDYIMTRIFKAAAVIAAMVLALSLFAACDDDDDSGGASGALTFDMSSFVNEDTSVSTLSTDGDELKDACTAENAVLIIFTFSSTLSYLTVYTEKGDTSSAIALAYLGAGTYALLIDTSGCMLYYGVVLDSDGKSFTYTLSLRPSYYDLSCYSDSLYISGQKTTLDGIYYY